MTGSTDSDYSRKKAWCLWSDLGDVLLPPDTARVGAGHGGVEHDDGAGALPADILLIVIVLNDVTVMVLVVR